MPHKIPFSVIYASSTDDEYNFKELEVHNPLVKGWVGGRFCLYPQEIVLRLPYKTRVRKLQLLAHQFLIPTKIEFFIGSLPPDHVNSLSGQRYKRLGYITLSDNSKTGFKARELKSVHVDAVGKYLRMVIYKNYVNKYNLYNQVGLVAVNVLGDEVTDEKGRLKANGVNHRLHDVINQHLPAGTFREDAKEHEEEGNMDPVVLGAINKPDYISPMDDLAFDMYQDPEVASIIRKLDNRKNEAVLQEQFDLAKRLKQAISDLQKVGERLGRYEVEKRRAIETEDYDLAKVKKIQMEEYRLQIYKQLELYDLLDVSKPASSQRRSPPKEQPTPRRQEPVIREPSPPTPRVVKPAGAVESPREQDAPGTFMYNADDRPLPTVKNSPRQPALEMPPVEEPEVHHEEEETGGGALDQSQGGEQMTSLNLSDNNMRDLDVASEVFGKDKVMKVYSKSWALREEGLNDVRGITEGAEKDLSKEEVRTMLRAAIFLATKGLKDKVYSVFSSAVELTRFIFTDFIPKHHKLGKHETSQGVDRVLPELMARISDTNAKLRSLDIDFIVEMACFPEVRHLHTIPHQCQAPFKHTAQPKTATTRVEIVEKLLKDLGTEKGSGMTTSSVMKFANQALEHTSGIVREAAINLIFELYKLKGSEVTDHLPSIEKPSTLKNPLYSRIYDGLDKIDGKPTRSEKKSQEKAAKDKEKKAKQAEIDGLQQQLADLRAAAAKNNSKRETPAPKDEKEKNKDKLAPKAAQNKKIPPRAPSIADASEYGEDIDQTCIFCGEKDQKFKDEGLDLHYWRFCPMLTKCSSCKQVVEVAGLTDHLLTECEKRTQFAKCPRCTETHSKADIDRYVTEKICQPSKSGSGRCPLCHTNIPDNEDSWRKHLMGKDGCKTNKRREPFLKRGGKPGVTPRPGKDKAGDKNKPVVRRGASKTPREK